jgi:DNA-binding Lrp family transcriptional regulator
MTKRLDIKDRKLLYWLAQNSRQSHSQLAARIGLSKNAVSYRVARLKRMGVIKYFTVVVNLGLLGYNTYDVLIRLRARPGEEKEILSFIVNHPFTVWVVSLSGSWDLLAEVAAKDFSHYNSIMDELLGFIGNRLDSYETHVALEIYKVEHLVRDFTSGLGIEFKPPPGREFEKTVKIDSKDRAILGVLAKAGNLPIQDIGKEVGLSHDVVGYRIKKLVKDGVILHFIPEINSKRIGYSDYLALLTLRGLSGKEKALKSFLKGHNNISYAFRGATKSEVIFVASVKTPEKMDSLMKELKAGYFDVIQSQSHLLITNHLKFNLFPPGLSGL